MHHASWELTDCSCQVVMENSLAQIDLLTKQYKQQFDIPYLPTLSTAWDSSPRTLPSDGCKRL